MRSHKTKSYRRILASVATSVAEGGSPFVWSDNPDSSQGDEPIIIRNTKHRKSAIVKVSHAAQPTEAIITAKRDVSPVQGSRKRPGSELKQQHKRLKPTQSGSRNVHSALSKVLSTAEHTNGISTQDVSEELVADPAIAAETSMAVEAAPVVRLADGQTYPGKTHLQSEQSEHQERSISSLGSSVLRNLPSPDNMRQDSDSSARGDSEASDADSSSEEEPEELIESLATMVHQLTHENHGLRQLLVAHGLFQEARKVHPKCQQLHAVLCDCHNPGKRLLFLDAPTFVGHSKSNHVAGVSEVDEARLRASQPEIVLIVYKIYRCSVSNEMRKQKLRDMAAAAVTSYDSIDPPAVGESMAITSVELCKAFRTAMEIQPNSKYYPKIEPFRQIPAPYVFLYHDREMIWQHARAAGPNDMLEVLVKYLDSFEKEFQMADALFRSGMVTLKTLQYLFKPDRLVIHNAGREPIALQTESYLSLPGIATPPVCSLSAWNYGYDGRFWVANTPISFSYPTTSDEKIPITSLDVYPLEYASQDVHKGLVKRGSECWKSRRRRYVTYRDKDVLEVRQTDDRYMIDYKVYNRAMESQSTKPSDQPDLQRKYLDDATMNSDEPPAERLLILLPDTIVGFNMLEKSWCKLRVSEISDVCWNKKAFDSLVVDPDTKDCVQALVTNQLSSKKSTDLISGKGNSLVILLHGGPGTGKTLTAESVAELAEKPLYRVTCGDIGTEAVAVERALQHVLYLGKEWGCVVLLDEADIFLEERSLQDLGRNALVSVFLRALEYYDGILILTTNRVGTFDEAFKSRIQLSLRYQALTEEQRRVIWENFCTRIGEIDEDNVDVADLRRNINELARHNMNGRQIRNNLTTARQLAQYKGERMNLSHLRHAIKVFIKFEEYLKDVKHNVSDEEIARDSGVR